MNDIEHVIHSRATLYILDPQFHLLEYRYTAETEVEARNYILELNLRYLWVCEVNEELRKCALEVFGAVIMADIIERHRRGGISGHLDVGAMGTLRGFLWWRRSAAELPFDEVVEACDLFPAFEPDYHLGKLIFMVCCSVRILCQVDVKAF